MNSKILFRKAEQQDVRQIAEICVEDWQRAYRGIIDSDYLDSLNVDDRYDIEMRRYQELTVAADEDLVLGYAWLAETEEEPADCEIIALYVRYEYRNKGIGKLLMQYAVDHFKKMGKKKMVIWCLKENCESRKFYEALGGIESETGSHNWGGRDYDMISYLYDLE